MSVYTFSESKPLPESMTEMNPKSQKVQDELGLDDDSSVSSLLDSTRNVDDLQNVNDPEYLRGSQLGLSAVYRLPNAPQNLQYLSPRAGAALPPHVSRTPFHSPDLPAESGNDLEDIVDPGRLTLGGDTENEEKVRASKRRFKIVNEVYA
jgi:hypothetical protein